MPPRGAGYVKSAGGSSSRRSSRAALIYADLYRRGELIGDADILIAATALVENLVLGTNNERHFRRVAGLAVENWAAAE